jgi:hypothetical protein
MSRRLTPLKRQQAQAKTEADPRASEKAYIKSFIQRYFALYRKRFESYRQASDTPMTEQDFDARFVSGDLTSLVDHKTPAEDTGTAPDFEGQGSTGSAVWRDG